MDKVTLTRIGDEEIVKLHEEFFGEGSCGSEIDDSDLCLKVADAQLTQDKADMEVRIQEERKAERDLILGKGRPKIICLCGSTRFTDIMLVKQWELTKQGYVVLTWCALPDWYFKGEDKSHIGDQEGVKELVDEVHKRKINLSDEVIVVNKDGYIGESTRSEIDYALSKGKPVKYLEALKQGKLPEGMVK